MPGQRKASQSVPHRSMSRDRGESSCVNRPSCNTTLHIMHGSYCRWLNMVHNQHQKARTGGRPDPTHPTHPTLTLMEVQYAVWPIEHRERRACAADQNTAPHVRYDRAWCVTAGHEVSRRVVTTFHDTAHDLRGREVSGTCLQIKSPHICRHYWISIFVGTKPCSLHRRKVDEHSCRTMAV